MPKTLNFLFDLVIWVIIPLVLCIVIFMTKKTSKDPDFVKEVKAIKSGFWGGIILVSIVLVYKVSTYLNSGFPDEPLFQGIDLAVTFSTSVIVLILFATKRVVAAHKTIGLTVLIITSVSSYALVDYLMIRENNELLISLTLGVAFGALLYFASSPKSLRDFLERTRR